MNKPGNADNKLPEKIRSAPEGPGCYLYKDRNGNIIYAGKAKNLRRRVGSYFTPSAYNDENLSGLVRRIQDVEYRITESELAALFLEYRLIKEYRPWFNSQLKRDEQRPCLRLGYDSSYPSLSIAEEIRDDGAEYVDSFRDSHDVRDTLEILGNIFGTPRCGKKYFNEPSAPCIYHSMGSCMAPCSARMDADSYSTAINEIRNLFSGKSVLKIAELEQKMAAAASALDFEKALLLRKQIGELQRLRKKSRRMNHFPGSGKVMVLIRPYRSKPFSVFFVRNGDVYHAAEFSGPPDSAALARMVDSWNEASQPLPDSFWLAGCLAEIYADTVFFRLPENISPGEIAEELDRFWRGEKD